MLPIPTRAAIAAFLGCLGVLSLGIGASSAYAVQLAGGGIVTLAFLFAMTIPLGRRARRNRLEFAWWLAHGTGGGTVNPRSPFEVRCYLRNRGREAIRLSSVRPMIPLGVRENDATAACAVDIPALSRTEFEVGLTVSAVGRIVLHGLAVTVRGPCGMFDVPLYFPNPLTIKVLPRAAARARRGLGAAPRLGVSVERSGRTMLRRRGGGTELHELRDFQPGDPFRSIAWKASARRGHLLVREVQAEVQDTHWWIVDIGGSMRDGELGLRKLDWAIETVATDARQILEAGNRVGLCTVDTRVVDYVPALDGNLHMLALYDTLIGATEIVDEDLTDIDPDELVAIVGRYVRSQDGLDFSRPERREGWSTIGLARHVERSMLDAPAGRPIASNPTLALLRAYCRERGIHLPYRVKATPGARSAGLAAALERVGARVRVPSFITVVSDFDGAEPLEPLVAMSRLLRAHRHTLKLVVPYARPSPNTTYRTTLERDLAMVLSRAEDHRIARARETFGRIGLPVTIVQPFRDHQTREPALHGRPSSAVARERVLVASA